MCSLMQCVVMFMCCLVMELLLNHQLNQSAHYHHKGGYVFAPVCVCECVSKIIQKVIDKFP